MEDQKVCGRCKATQDIEEFSRRGGTRTDRHSWCKTCKRRYNKDHYESNLEQERLRVAFRRDRHAELMMVIIKEAKSVPCADCDETYPHYVMDFDHVRGEKLFNIGQGAPAPRKPFGWRWQSAKWCVPTATDSGLTVNNMLR